MDIRDRIRILTHALCDGAEMLALESTWPLVNGRGRYLFADMLVRPGRPSAVVLVNEQDDPPIAVFVEINPDPETAARRIRVEPVIASLLGADPPADPRRTLKASGLLPKGWGVIRLEELLAFLDLRERVRADLQARDSDTQGRTLLDLLKALKTCDKHREPLAIEFDRLASETGLSEAVETFAGKTVATSAAPARLSSFDDEGDEETMTPEDARELADSQADDA